MKRNPFNTVSHILKVTGTILLGLLVLGWFGLMIWTAVDRYTWHVLWQVPLVFASFFAVVGVLYWIGKGIGKAWNYFSDRWDRNHGVN